MYKVETFVLLVALRKAGGVNRLVFFFVFFLFGFFLFFFLCSFFEGGGG